MPISIHTSLEFYHVVVLHLILTLTFLKVLLKSYLVYFLKITTLGVTFDANEVFPTSPRLIGLFTISFLAYSTFIGKTNIDRT
jgi:hypothetical protein